MDKNALKMSHKKLSKVMLGKDVPKHILVKNQNTIQNKLLKGVEGLIDD